MGRGKPRFAPPRLVAPQSAVEPRGRGGLIDLYSATLRSSPTLCCIAGYAGACYVMLGPSFAACGAATEDKSALRERPLRINLLNPGLGLP
jgi:hypothetical protein